MSQPLENSQPQSCDLAITMAAGNTQYEASTREIAPVSAAMNP